MRNDSFTRNETLSYEAQALQEILKINELMRQVRLNEQFRGDLKLSPRTYKSSEDEGNSSPDRFHDDAREIHFHLTSRNISSPKGRNISSGTSSRNAESGRDKFSESVDTSEKGRTPSSNRFTLTKNDRSVKLNELDVLHSTTKENCASSNAKGESRISRRWVRKEEDRSIGDALFSCPFELVEIYSNKIGKNSGNDLDLAFDVNRQTCSMRAFPKEGGEQFQIEKNQLSASEIKSNKSKGETCMDKVDEISQKTCTKHDDLQRECEEENCQNCNETVQEKCALNNSVINEDLCTKSNEDSQENEEPQEALENDASETTVVKLIQDRENSIVDSRLENDGTMQINKQNPLDESFASTSEGAGANQDVNLITIFEATGKPCVEKTDEENDFNKRTNTKRTNHSSTFKLQESCVKSDVIEDARSLERSKDTNNVNSRTEGKEDVPSTIKGQTSELTSANISSISRSLKRVAKNHDLFVEEKRSKSLKSSESANNAMIRIEEEASKENLRRDVVSIDNLDTSENTDYSKFHKLANKVEENVSSTFQEEGGQSVKMKRQRGTLNAGSREINAFGSDSLKPKAEGMFAFEGGHRNTETKCQRTSSNVDSREPRLIDGNLFEQCSVNSNERQLTEHSEFDDVKDSRSNLSSSLEDVNHQEEESNVGRRDASEDSSKGNKIKIIIEKRQSRENRVVNKDVIGGNKDLLRNKDIQSSMIKNERAEERDSDDFYKYETATRESRRIGINYEDLNVCKVLTKVHERLTSDWQRMEQLRAKLQIQVSAELANPMMTLQLLDKTIARYRVKIH